MTEQSREPEEQQGQARSRELEQKLQQAQEKLERAEEEIQRLQEKLSGKKLANLTPKLKALGKGIARWYDSLDEGIGEILLLKHGFRQLLAFPTAWAVYAVLNNDVKPHFVAPGTYAEWVFSRSEDAILTVFLGLIIVRLYVVLVVAYDKAREQIELSHEERRKRKDKRKRQNSERPKNEDPN